ncbi:hypothetical protein GCM10010406_21570 [Streptomyces thermolineatus]|uniref:Uncharacterized protein n=1 Tax=Streptomyces thermolineatus TaxID=44033 RepID=A0ABN3LIP9_9ACTN
MSRRPPQHGTRACYLAGCRRPECSNANIRYAKLYRLERARSGPRRVSSAAAAQRVSELRDAGWSIRQIAAAADCAFRTIQSLVNNNYATIRGDLATRILSAQPTLRTVPGSTYINAVGSIRRIRALIAIGYPIIRIAEAVGMSKNALGRVINHEHDKLTAENARAIADVYRRWAGTPGPSARARAHAAKRGWASPAAWDDIDDPNCVPDVDEQRELSRMELAAVRRAEIEHLAAFGISTAEIAKRVGLTEGDVRDRIRDLRAARAGQTAA